jgi:teichuronic acid biosynthesis glycosyltransferase TuaG
MISIITPMFNNEELIEKTIESVKNQTYKEWEMFIVDDCSKDESLAVARKFIEYDERFNLISLKVNSGAAVSRNTGLEMAKGRYVAFLDSDDLWQPDKLSKQLKFMQENDEWFTYTNYGRIDYTGRILNEGFKIPMNSMYKDLLKNTAIGCSTVMIDRNKAGDFRMPLKRAGQDTATWLMLLRNGGRAAGLNEPLTWYRKTEGSISSNKIKALQRTWDTYRNYEKLTWLRAVYFFSFYVVNAMKRRYGGNNAKF